MALKKVFQLFVLGAAVVAMNTACSTNAEAAGKKGKKDGGVTADAGMSK